ncbi:MAG TPA: YMGG-like glycine zipper-containing protein [Candidatus Hydrogenedentes bacterium]|nr:YMGG-like glycine zipper-containing protein [Candidatus Hydrogenedentota bacterium]HQH53462.1 YMGG-like glycine zipper-containing protein [Candidatus Hydrogenedentota bacterium]
MRQVRIFVMVLCLAGCLVLSLLASAQEGQQKKKSTIRGAGIGALLGQAIGNDTESTLIGGALGAGVGHVVGKKKEKEQAQSTQPAQPAQPAAAEPQGKEKTEAKPPDPAEALYDSFWQVKSISPKGRVQPFFSKLVLFLRDGYVQTLTTTPEGKVTLSEEPFSAVDDTLVINKPDYTMQARYKVDEDQLILSADDFSAVLKRIQPE